MDFLTRILSKRPDLVWRPAACLTLCLPWLLVTHAGADIALSAIAVLFLLHSFTVDDTRWCKEGWVRILVALWMLMIARSLLAEHPGDALARALPFVRYFVFAAALARWTLRDERIRRLFMLSLTWAALFWAMDGLLQRILGVDMFLYPFIRDPLAGHIRLTGVFGKRPVLGVMLAWLCFPACLYLLQPDATRQRSLLQKGLRIASAALVFCVIALSGERMALLLTLLGITLLFFLLPAGKQIIGMGFAASLLGIAALSFASPDFFQRQIGSTVDTLAHWRESPYGTLLASDLRLAESHPLTGVGPNQFRYACQALYPGDAPRIQAMCNIHPHNIYMEWLIEEGVPGLALFLGFLAAVALQVKRDWKVNAAHWALPGFTVALMLRIWPFASSTSFFSPWGAPSFWLALGGLLAYSGLHDTRKDAPC